MTPHKPSLRGPNQMANRRPFRVISCHDAIELFERRFTPNSGHAAGRLVSPLSANSGVVHHNKFELPMSAMGHFLPRRSLAGAAAKPPIPDSKAADRPGYGMIIGDRRLSAAAYLGRASRRDVVLASIGMSTDDEMSSRQNGRNAPTPSSAVVLAS